MQHHLERALALQGRSKEPVSSEARLELLLTVVENLMDEVRSLEERLLHLELAGGRELEELLEEQRRRMLELRFSSAGAVSWSVRKWAEYLETTDERAERLIPDPVEREETLRRLASLT